MQTTYKRGFTLIELLVVIAIIGILASIVLASLNSARQKGRDARRVSDIKEIQLALELYYDAHGAYPTALSAANLVTPGYISTIPTDPSNGNSYSYTPYAASGSTATCSSYHLGASLEVASSTPLNDDADAYIGTGTLSGESAPAGLAICTAAGSPTSDFHGADTQKCNSTDAGSYCYDVMP